jgi:predicted XRE-type DNA-binding protein
MIAARTHNAMDAAEAVDVDGEEITVTESSGNVFEDLGFAAPAEMLLKAELARQIGRIIRDRGLTQVAAARILGVDQPKVSALLRGRLLGFTIDRLVRYAAALGQSVDLVIRPREHVGGQGEPAGTVTIPPDLRTQLEEAARVEGVDLGTYVVTLLSRRATRSRVERKAQDRRAGDAGTSLDQTYVDHV